MGQVSGVSVGWKDSVCKYCSILPVSFKDLESDFSKGHLLHFYPASQ